MISRLKREALRMMPPGLAGRLRAWRIRRLIRGFTPHVVEHVYGSGPLRVYLSDPLARGWYDHDWVEPPEFALLRRGRLRPGARVFDIGAHQGVVALMLAREVGPAGRVVAVEPSAHNTAAVARNRDLNRVGQVEVVTAAVSDRPGRLTFNAQLNGQLDDGSGSSGRVDVEAVTVDGLADRFGTPDVVFLDVEGAEHLALAGAAAVLAAGPDLFIEVHVGCGLERLGGSVDRVLATVPAERYDRWWCPEGETEFRPWSEGTLPVTRFYLVALGRPRAAGS